jgi:hypothetical protein
VTEEGRGEFVSAFGVSGVGVYVETRAEVMRNALARGHFLVSA